MKRKFKYTERLSRGREIQREMWLYGEGTEVRGGWVIDPEINLSVKFSEYETLLSVPKRDETGTRELDYENPDDRRYEILRCRAGYWHWQKLMFASLAFTDNDHSYQLDPSLDGYKLPTYSPVHGENPFNEGKPIEYFLRKDYKGYVEDFNRHKEIYRSNRESYRTSIDISVPEAWEAPTEDQFEKGYAYNMYTDGKNIYMGSPTVSPDTSPKRARELLSSPVPGGVIQKEEIQKEEIQKEEIQKQEIQKVKKERKPKRKTKVEKEMEEIEKQKEIQKGEGIQKEEIQGIQKVEIQKVEIQKVEKEQAEEKEEIQKQEMQEIKDNTLETEEEPIGIEQLLFEEEQDYRPSPFGYREYREEEVDYSEESIAE